MAGNEEELKGQCMSLIDSEYDALRDFTKKDLYDYLASQFDISRELSNELHREMF